jgi:hypothetical protein
LKDGSAESPMLSRDLAQLLGAVNPRFADMPAKVDYFPGRRPSGNCTANSSASLTAADLFFDNMEAGTSGTFRQ